MRPIPEGYDTPLTITQAARVENVSAKVIRARRDAGWLVTWQTTPGSSREMTSRRYLEKCRELLVEGGRKRRGVTGDDSGAIEEIDMGEAINELFRSL